MADLEVQENKIGGKIMNERCDPCAEFTITLTGKQANYLFDAIDCFDYALLTILPRQQYQELKEVAKSIYNLFPNEVV